MKLPSSTVFGEALETLLSNIRMENNITAQPSSLAQQLDENYTLLQTALRHFEQEVTKISVDNRRARNSLSDFHTLPVELHTEILLLAISSEQFPIPRLAELSTVAKVWWDIVQSIPALWAFVRTGCVGAPIALERSRNMPLHVVMDDEGAVINSDQENLERFSNELEVLGQDIHRWRTAELRSGLFPPAFKLIERALPFLQELKAHCIGNSVYLHAGEAPHLRHLHISRVAVLWTEALMPRLEFLWIQSLIFMGAAAVTEFLYHLEACPALKDLRLEEIKCVLDGGEAVPHPSVARCCPDLQYLFVRKVSEDITFPLLKGIQVSRPDSLNVLIDLVQGADIFSFCEKLATDVPRALAQRFTKAKICLDLYTNFIKLYTEGCGRFTITGLDWGKNDIPDRIASFLPKIAPEAVVTITFDEWIGGLDDDSGGLGVIPHLQVIRFDDCIKDAIDTIVWVARSPATHFAELKEIRLNEMAWTFGHVGRSVLEAIYLLGRKRPGIIVTDRKGVGLREGLETQEWSTMTR